MSACARITVFVSSIILSTRTRYRRGPVSSFPRSFLDGRTDLSPFVAVNGQDRPAVSVDEKQICVEGLRHGERYNVTLRAGIPSAAKEIIGQERRVQHLCA